MDFGDVNSSEADTSRDGFSNIFSISASLAPEELMFLDLSVPTSKLNMADTTIP